MILRESKWYRDIIRKRVHPGSLVLNIGSSTKHVTEVQQPYIKKNVLDELVAKRCVIKNIDIKQSEGVDIIGNISDPNFAAELRNMKPDIIICANTLEHIENRHAFCVGLESILGDQTTLLISVPHTFPYHEDPIDTMYRTDVAGLSREFPLLRLVEKKLVTMCYFSVIARKYNVLNRIILFIKTLIKLFLAVVTGQRNEVDDLRWSFRKVHEICAVYVRQSVI